MSVWKSTNGLLPLGFRPVPYLTGLKRFGAAKEETMVVEAFFYIGMFHSLRGENPSANEFYQKVVGLGITSSYEYHLANRELNRRT